MSETREPFDPADPFQIMCEHFRRAVLTAAQEAIGLTVFRELRPDLQISAVIMGSLTGIIQCGFTYAKVLPSVQRETFEAAIVDGIRESVSEAEFQARTCKIIP